MLLSKYAEASLLCNISFTGKTSRPNEYAFRGDLVLIEGEIADVQGRRMPPVSVIRQAIVLANETTLTLLIGALHELSELELVFERYAKDFDAEVRLLLFVENIGKAMITELQGHKVVLLPIEDTPVWSETVDELRLEKDDFKGKSSEDKVVTLLRALGDYQPKYPTLTWSDALGMTVAVKREGRGAV